jgi:hypothetical protein
MSRWYNRCQLWSTYVEIKKFWQKIFFFVLIVLECSDINCLNNGTCVALSMGNYRCNCAPGYGGAYCQYSKFDFIGILFGFF